VPPTITVSKTPSSGSLPEPGGIITFSPSLCRFRTPQPSSC
jgi:hypothetical protein